MILLLTWIISKKKKIKIILFVIQIYLLMILLLTWIISNKIKIILFVIQIYLNNLSLNDSMWINYTSCPYLI